MNANVRTIIERLSRGVYLKRRLPSRFGRTPLYVSPDSQLKYLKLGDGAFDAELIKIVYEHIRDDSVVWDIGANVGVFAFASASIAKKGKVLAVEADIWLAQLITRSLLLKENCGLNIQVLPSAIADRNGIATFLIAKRGRASSALEAVGGRSQTGGIRKKVIVPTLTLDTLLEFFNPPSFIKIDVEGAETMVLNGANRLLTEIRPTFYIEVGKETDEEVTSIFQRHCFKLFDGSRPIQDQEPAESCAFNTLAVPTEMLNTTNAR